MVMQHISSRKRFYSFVIALLCLSVIARRGFAEPVPGRYDKLITQGVVEVLHQAHLNRPEIGDDLSKRLFHKFLKDVDPGKLYLLNADYEEFKKYETTLDDELLQGEMRF